MAAAIYYHVAWSCNFRHYESKNKNFKEIDFLSQWKTNKVILRNYNNFSSICHYLNIIHVKIFSSMRVLYVIIPYELKRCDFTLPTLIRWKKKRVYFINTYYFIVRIINILHISISSRNQFSINRWSKKIVNISYIYIQRMLN